MSVAVILLLLDICAITGTLYFAWYLVSHFLKNKFLPLPPGPKPRYLIGNLLDLPNAHDGRFWAKHKDLYGPISSVTTLGLTFIIINDRRIASELLEKRAQMYSNRYVPTFVGKVLGFENMTQFLQYGGELKHHRTLMQTYVGSRAALDHVQELQEIEARRFLLKVFEEPSGFFDHIGLYSGAIILKIAYGYTADRERKDPLVDLVEKTFVDIFATAATPGKWLVDAFPPLRFLPNWFPMVKFKKQAQLWEQTISDCYDKPIAFVRRQMASGHAIPSFTSHCIEEGLADSEQGKESMKNAAITLFAAGADTVATALITFFLMMALNQSVLRRAQGEVDKVIGSDRLPSFGDRGDLPYINALVKELLRWESVTPVAVPHCVAEEDTYAGYRIPKGAVILPNTWQMSHDPDVYRDPFTVKPERFLSEGGHKPEPDPLAFGFGRRICPGKIMADNFLYISIALLLSTFDISKAKNDKGQEIELECTYSSGIISHPSPFTCAINCRSEKAAELIKSVSVDFPFEKGDGDIISGL